MQMCYQFDDDDERIFLIDEHDDECNTWRNCLCILRCQCQLKFEHDEYEQLIVVLDIHNKQTDAKHLLHDQQHIDDDEVVQLAELHKEIEDDHDFVVLIRGLVVHAIHIQNEMLDEHDELEHHDMNFDVICDHIVVIEVNVVDVLL